MNVEHILASKGREVRTIKPGALVGDALQRLRAERIGSLVVSENGTDLLGILSDRDILHAIAEHGTAVLGESVGSAMTEKVYTCSRDDRVSAIMALMATRQRVGHIPRRGSQASIDRSSSIPRPSAKRAKSAIEASTMRLALETTQGRRRNRASQCRWRAWSRSMPCVSSLPTNSRPCGISSGYPPQSSVQYRRGFQRSTRSSSRLKVPASRPPHSQSTTRPVARS